jgi:hypothetical protein
MARPIPCLGYRSRTEAVLALRAQGFSTDAIAAKTGIEPNQVTALEASAARFRRPTRPVPLIEGALLLTPHLLHALAPHAGRRGMTPAALAHLIIEAVVADGIIDAALDDSTDGRN